MSYALTAVLPADEAARLVPVADKPCPHKIPCPSATADDRYAAQRVSFDATVGAETLCNGLVVFTDGGVIRPQGDTVVADDPAEAQPSEYHNTDLADMLAEVTRLEAAGLFDEADALFATLSAAQTARPMAWSGLNAAGQPVTTPLRGANDKKSLHALRNDRHPDNRSAQVFAAWYTPQGAA